MFVFMIYSHISMYILSYLSYYLSYPPNNAKPNKAKDGFFYSEACLRFFLFFFKRERWRIARVESVPFVQVSQFDRHNLPLP